MKTYKEIILIGAIMLFSFIDVFSQTSWTGADNTKWKDTGNWTNGVPGMNTDAIIGDANFTGAYQPEVKGKTANCRNLTLGNGSKVSELTINTNLNIHNNLVIGANGTINHGGNNRTITITGNWDNSGTYSPTGGNVQVTFGGISQTITGATNFENVSINNSTIVTLNDNISISGDMYINGTLDPTVAYNVFGTGNLIVNSGGTLKVKATNFSDNYSVSGTITLNGNSTVDYASSTIAQNISDNFTYCNLVISGGTTKSLVGNLPPLYSANGLGGIEINNGVLDLKTYIADRGAGVGGYFIITAGSTLKIGGTNGFPANYNNTSFATTSTVSYYGNDQSVLATSYGNLSFSSSSGTVVKTMPVAVFNVLGDFSCRAGDGTGVSFTAGNNISFSGNVTLGPNSTFSASSHNIELFSNLTNSGTINGNTSTFDFYGNNAEISGSGTHNYHNINFNNPGIIASDTTQINVSGDLIISSGGSFTHQNGGILIMSGASKKIQGSPIVLSNYNITGSITGYGAIEVTGDLSVDGSYTGASLNDLIMSGTGKSILGTGTIVFYGLDIAGEITTSRNITINKNFIVETTGSFTASNGTISIDGNASFSGIANLYHLTINSAKSLTMGSNSVIGIAGALTVTGSLDVSSNIPNTISYNASGAQNITNTSYYNLTTDGSGIKTPLGNFLVANDLTISDGSTLDASSYTLTINGDFSNFGSFTAGTSIIQLGGDYASSVIGNTTFNDLIINKSLSTTWVTLRNNISVRNIDLFSGNLDTDSDTITITGTRLNSGIILGTIKRQHAFTNATAYYFEGPNNYIQFSSPSGDLNSVTVNVDVGFVTDFDNISECVTRKYTVSVPNGTYTDADFSFHYEQNEVNAFIEPDLVLYRYNTNTLTWDSIGADTRDEVNNYVEKLGNSNITSKWIATGDRNIVRWNGSTSSAWNEASNWTTISGDDMSNRVPTASDVAQIGYDVFTNNPTLSSSDTVNVLRFGGLQEATLSINTDTLTTIGSVRGIWSANAHHTIDVTSGTLDVGTNLSLSEDTSGHYITLNIGSGTVKTTYNLNDNSYGEIVFTGAGVLDVGKNFNYSTGTFTRGSGTVIYSGSSPQVVAPVTYNNLSFSKTAQKASINNKTTVKGNFSLNNGGGVELNDSLIVTGNFTIGAGTELIEQDTYLSIEGNWENNGTFTSTSGTVCFDGSLAQTVNSSSFNGFQVNKSSGTLTSTGDISISGNLFINNGTFDLDTFLANRVHQGGTFTLNGGAYMKVTGADNFPERFSNIEMDTTSTVEYDGSVSQSIDSVVYGNLIFTNGGPNEKILTGDIEALGNFTINPGATVEPGSNSLKIYGNFSNNGTFNPATSTLILDGDTKTFSGETTLYNLYTISGDYTFISGPISINGDIIIDESASLNFGDVTLTLFGDATNKGALTSSGNVSFAGTQVQRIRLLNAITSSSTGVINFNGSVEPILSSTSSPNFSTININNTAGVKASVPWTVYLAMNIDAAAAFHGGALTHTIYGNFTNNGTFTSEGKINFVPAAPYSAGATLTLDGSDFTSTGIVEFGGSVPVTISENSPFFTNVSITNTHATGITFPDGIAVPGNLLIGAGAILNGGTGQTITLSGSLTNNGTFDAETSTVLCQGTPTSISGFGTNNFYNLTIDAAAELKLQTAINIAGDFINNNIFTPEGYTVKFNGSTPSTIGGTTSPAVFDVLENDKTLDSTSLNVPVTINNSLILTNGMLHTTSTNLLTLIDDATSTSGTKTSFVTGPIKKIGNDAFVFPVGNDSIWGRIGITAPSDVNDQFSAEYADSGYANTTNLAAPLYNVSENEYWTLTRDVGTSNIAVTLYWDTTRSNITDLSDLRVARFDGTNWVSETQNGGTTGTTSAGSVTSQTVTSFSPFTFGSLSSEENPLPVEWLSFTAKLKSGQVEVCWSTASEINNDYFIVERGKDPLSFTRIEKVNSRGNYPTGNSYCIFDEQPMRGLNYYRLKQVDLDGGYAYSDIVLENVHLDSGNFVTIYPNPGKSKGDIKLRFKSLDFDRVNVTLYRNTGQKLFEQSFHKDSFIGKDLIISSNKTGALSPGQYVLVIDTKLHIIKKVYTVD